MLAARSEPLCEMDLIDTAKAALLIWHEYEVDMGRASYYRGETKRKSSGAVPEEIVRTPDLLDKARRLRPQNWRRNPAHWNFKRADVKRPLAVAEISYTARGTDSSRPGESKDPAGKGSRLEVVSESIGTELRQVVRARMEILRLMTPTMNALSIIDAEAHMAIEMWAAGYQLGEVQQRIRKILNQKTYSRNSAIKAQSCGWTWVAGCLLVKPEFPDDEPDPPRMMLEEEL